MAHPAWKPRAPEWVALAPGVKWLCKPLDGVIQAEVNARVAKLIGGLQQGRADLDDLGFDGEDMGVLSDLNVLAGLSVFAAAVYTAERLVDAWTFADPDTGAPIDVTPEAIRMALRVGPPEGGPSLLNPFMSWCDKPRQPIAAEQRRLRALAQWEHSTGRDHCEGCAMVDADCPSGGTDGGERCPRLENAPQTEPGVAALAATRHAGVWLRGGMAGQVVGLDYAGCLAIAEATGEQDRASVVRCLQAIEAGALAAAAERAKSES